MISEIYKQIKYANLDYIISNDVIVGYKGKDYDEYEIIDIALKELDLPRRSVVDGILDDTFSSVRFRDERDIDEKYKSQRAYIFISEIIPLEDGKNFNFIEVPQDEFEELLRESITQANEERRLKIIAKNLHINASEMLYNHIVDNYVKIK